MGWVDVLLNVIASFARKKPQAPAAGRPLPEDRLEVLAKLDPSPYGLTSHTASPQFLEMFADAGIRWHRIDVTWGEIEREPGTYDWSNLDPRIQTARTRNLSLLGVIAYSPRWCSSAPANASADPIRAAMPTDPSAFLRFIDAVLDHFPDTFAALSIWNEPNLEQFFKGRREDYLAKLLQPALRRIRERAPRIALCGPDLSSGHDPQEWLGAVLDAAGDFLDVITHHQYNGGDTSSGRAQAIDELHDFIVAKGYGDRPLWITETGWQLGDKKKTTKADQARLLRETMTAMAQRSGWWRKTFWYDSHGVGWGIVGGDGQADEGQPYPAFEAYRDVISKQTSA